MKSKMARTPRKGAAILMNQTSPPVRMDSEGRLRWLLGFALESSELRSSAELRRVHEQIGAYLGGLLIRKTSQEGHGLGVMEVSDPRRSEALPMVGRANQKPLEDKLALIRMGVRRIVNAFLRAPTASRRVMGEITCQRILETNLLRPSTVREQWVVADVQEAITFRLLEDLAQAGALVRECPATGCGKIFVRRYRQEFCSTACRNRTNFRIWYERTRKARKGTVMSPHARRRKRRTPLRRVRIMGNPTRRTNSA